MARSGGEFYFEATGTYEPVSCQSGARRVDRLLVRWYGTPDQRANLNETLRRIGEEDGGAGSFYESYLEEYVRVKRLRVGRRTAEDIAALSQAEGILKRDFGPHVKKVVDAWREEQQRRLMVT